MFAMAVNASTDSVIFFDGDRNLNKRYNISFCIDSTRNFAELARIAGIAGNAPVWLSWTIFEKTIQTEEFPDHSAGISNYKDTILASCTEKAIVEQFPLRIYLCTHDRILGVAEVANSMFRNPQRPVPLQYTNWFPFSLGADATSSQSDEVAIQLTVTVDEIEGGVSVMTAAGGNVVSSGVDDGREEDEEDEYCDDDFDGDDCQTGADTATDTGADTDGSDRDGRGKSSSGRHKRDKKHHRAHFTDDQEEKEEEEEEASEVPEEAEFVDEFQNTHYRMSIDIRTIGGINRASHIQIQFVYPHLGSNAHIRSKPMWVRSATEAKVEGAVAVYDFVMTKAACKSVCATNPLHVSILSKTNLGNEPFGEFAVDLTCVLTAKIHSVRCPTTNISFKTLSDFAEHRARLQAQQQSEINAGNGVFTVIPPAIPIITRALDTYYDVSEVLAGPVPQGPGARQTGGRRVGKVRVLLILEDIGAVVGGGARAHAVPVRPGYKHGGAAVYQGGTSGGDGQSSGHSQGHNHDQNHGSLPPVPPYTSSGSLPQSEEDAERRFEERVEREVAKLRRKIAVDMNKHLANKADDLRKAQEETNKLELRLRSTIESAEKQRNNLIMQEESMNMKLIQKTHELQLLQKRVRDDASVKIEAEMRRSTALQSEVDKLKEDIKKERARYKEVDEMYDRLKSAVKNMSEVQLKEEVAKARTQFLDCKAELERERRKKAEAESEKEHYRAQMHRLALALKREREKTATIARQDLEQLRLEYLAREERYVLDGDREELNAIRHELSSLRKHIS
jgi:hypothetical protein